MKVTDSMIGAGCNIYFRDIEISQLVDELEGTTVPLLSKLYTELKKIDDENQRLRMLECQRSEKFRPEFHERV